MNLLRSKTTTTMQQPEPRAGSNNNCVFKVTSVPERSNRSLPLPFLAVPAIMADVVAEQIVVQKAVHERELNGEAEVRGEADPVEEAAKKKKKKKKKSKSATTGEGFL